jgi:hypothetical protein
MMSVWGMTRRVLSRVALGTAAVLLTTSGAALAVTPNHEVTIGPNLKTAPNVTFGCTYLPFYPFHVNTPSCMWGTPLVPGTAEGGLSVPGTGTIYRVRLRVGPSTGLMRLVVLRVLAPISNPKAAQCCVLVARTSTFTPAANSIKTLSVNLPVRQGALGSTAVLDTLGLQVIGDNTAIPLIDETNLPIGLKLGDRPFDTFNTAALTLGHQQLTNGVGGYLLDMQAQWYPPGQHP